MRNNTRNKENEQYSFKSFFTAVSKHAISLALVQWSFEKQATIEFVQKHECWNIDNRANNSMSFDNNTRN